MSLSETFDCDFYVNGVVLSDEWLSLSTQEIKRIVRDIIQEGAERIADYARMSAPVRTGRLRNSIQSAPNENGATVEATVPYAAPVNYGHVTASGSFVPANPFFTNAIDMILPEIEREIDEEVTAYLRLQQP